MAEKIDIVGYSLLVLAILIWTHDIIQIARMLAH